MPKEVTLYQVKGKSPAGPVDWKALVDKVSGAHLIEQNKTNCVIKVPEGSIEQLDDLLKREYRNVERGEERDPPVYIARNSAVPVTVEDRARFRRW